MKKGFDFIKSFASLLILSMILICVSSCSNFLAGSGLKEDIENQIAYYNAREAKVTINASPETTAQIVPAPGNYYKKPTNTIELSYICNSGYTFASWQCSPAGSVKFDNPNKKQTIATIIDTTSDIIITPLLKYTAEKDTEVPVVKEFRVGRTEDAVTSSDNSKLFLSDVSLFDSSYNIYSSNIYSSLDEQKVWIYFELEDDGIIDQVKLYEKGLENPFGESLANGFLCDLSKYITYKDGKVIACFEYNLKLEDDGIIELSLVQIKDEKGNLVDSDKKYYIVRHSQYLFKSLVNCTCDLEDLTYKYLLSNSKNKITFVAPYSYITKDNSKPVNVEIYYKLAVESSFQKIDNSQLTVSKQISAIYERDEHKGDFISYYDKYEINLDDLGINTSQTVFFRVVVKDVLNNPINIEAARYGPKNIVIGYSRSTSGGYQSFYTYETSEFLAQNGGSYKTDLVKLDCETKASEDYHSPDRNGGSPSYYYTSYHASTTADLSNCYKLEKLGDFSEYSKYKINLSVSECKSTIESTILSTKGMSATLKEFFVKICADDLYMEFPINTQSSTEYEKVFYAPKGKSVSLNFIWYCVRANGALLTGDISEPQEGKQDFIPGWYKYTNDYDLDGCKKITDEQEIPVYMGDSSGEYVQFNKPNIPSGGSIKSVAAYYKNTNYIYGFSVENYLHEYHFEATQTKSNMAGTREVTAFYSPTKLITWKEVTSEEIENTWETVPVTENGSRLQLPITGIEDGVIVFFIKAVVTDKNGNDYEALDGFFIDKQNYPNAGHGNDSYYRSETFIKLFGNRFTEAWNVYCGYNFRYETYSTEESKWNSTGTASNFEWSTGTKYNYGKDYGGGDAYPENSFIRLHLSESDKGRYCGRYVNTYKGNTFFSGKNITYNLNNYIIGSRGLICYFDQPTLVETLVNDKNYGDSYEDWEANTLYADYLNPQVITSSQEAPASYQIPLSSIEKGKYYCVLIHYSNGEIEVAYVNQKK